MDSLFKNYQEKESKRVNKENIDSDNKKKTKLPKITSLQSWFQQSPKIKYLFSVKVRVIFVKIAKARTKIHIIEDSGTHCDLIISPAIKSLVEFKSTYLLNFIGHYTNEEKIPWIFTNSVAATPISDDKIPKVAYTPLNINAILNASPGTVVDLIAIVTYISEQKRHK
jgi:hypothetical protein